MHATCVDLTDVLGSGSPAQLQPLRSAAGPLLVPIDRALIDLVWHNERLPVGGGLPRHAPPHRAPPHAVGGRRRALRPGARRRAGARARARLRGRRRRGGSRAAGCAVCALDTELLGHWWHEGRRLAGGDRSRRATAAGVELVPLDAALAGVDAAPAPRRAARHELGRAARPRDLERAAGRRARLAAREAELRVLAAGRASGAARAARAAGPPGLRLGVRRDARDRGPLLARAARSATPPGSSARSPIRPESVPPCATLHLLSTCLTVNFRVS